MGKSNNSRKGTKRGIKSKEDHYKRDHGPWSKRAYQGAKRTAVRGALAYDCTALELGVCAKNE